MSFYRDRVYPHIVTVLGNQSTGRKLQIVYRNVTASTLIASQTAYFLDKVILRIR
jgi:hypothetical protein